MNRTKKKYNEMLERYNKAVEYFGSLEPQETKLKHMQSFKNIAAELSRLLREIGDYTAEEALEGFKE